MADKATRIDLFSLRTPAMRAFHLTWMAFFVCFFAWFACAPLMPLVNREFGLSADQVANINIAAGAVTILVRLVIGPMCDRYGPRKVYSGLLLAGAFSVLGAAVSTGYESFLLCRVLIGAVGASFVITQYHTSMRFAPNGVGAGNATAAGWGNTGAGAAQALVPLLRAIDPGSGLNDDRDAGVMTSSGSAGEGGSQQRHAANPRPARLRGPWRPERSRRRSVMPR